MVTRQGGYPLFPAHKKAKGLNSQTHSKSLSPLGQKGRSCQPPGTPCHFIKQRFKPPYNDRLSPYGSSRVSTPSQSCRDMVSPHGQRAQSPPAPGRHPVTPRGGGTDAPQPHGDILPAHRAGELTTPSTSWQHLVKARRRELTPHSHSSTVTPWEGGLTPCRPRDGSTAPHPRGTLFPLEALGQIPPARWGLPQPPGWGD